MKYLVLKKADSIIAVATNVALVLGTFYVAYRFAVGDYKHPLFFLDGLLAWLTKYQLRSPGMFETVPTFDGHGLLVLFTWPMYKLSGIATFMYMGIAAQHLAFYLENILEKSKQNK